MVGTIARRKVGRRRRSEAVVQAESFVTAFPTELNWMAIAWRDEVIERVAFGYASRRQAELAVTRPFDAASDELATVVDAASDEVPAMVRDLMDDLRRFAEGEPVDFSHVELSLDHLTPFALKVVKACRRIGWGKTKSYGELAQQCGASGAARAVGSVMAKNRFPLIVPCHRVLGAGGALGGYSAPDGLAMKRRLLAMEGDDR